MCCRAVTDFVVRKATLDEGQLCPRFGVPVGGRPAGWGISHLVTLKSSFPDSSPPLGWVPLPLLSSDLGLFSVGTLSPGLSARVPSKRKDGFSK